MKINKLEEFSHHSKESKRSSDRVFGLTLFAVFLAIIIYRWIFKNSFDAIQMFLAIAAVLLLFVTLIYPKLLMWPNIIWMKFGRLLHHIMSPIVLGLLFFGILTPFALVMRYMKGDFLGLISDPERDTYWEEKNPQGPPAEGLKNQF